MEVEMTALRLEISQLTKGMQQITEFAHTITKHLAKQDEKLERIFSCIELLLPKTSEVGSRKVSFANQIPNVSSQPTFNTIASASDGFTGTLATCKSSPSMTDDRVKESENPEGAVSSTVRISGVKPGKDLTTLNKNTTEKSKKQSKLRKERHVKRKAASIPNVAEDQQSKGMPYKKFSCESGVFSADELITDDISDEVIYESDSEASKGLEITVTGDSESSSAFDGVLDTSPGVQHQETTGDTSTDTIQALASEQIPKTPHNIVIAVENTTEPEGLHSADDIQCDVTINVAESQQPGAAEKDKTAGKNNLSLTAENNQAQGRRASYAGLTLRQKQAIDSKDANADKMTPAHMGNGLPPRCASSCDLRPDTPKSDAGDTCADRRLFEIKRQFSNTSTGSAPGGVHLTIPSIETDSSDDDTEIKLPPPPAPKFNHRTVTVKSSTYKHFYELKEPIGGGRFGRVYRCVEKKTGMQLAAKCFQCKKKITTSLSKANSLKKAKIHLKTKRTEQEPVDKEDVLIEISIMNQIDHENIIKLYDAYENDNTMTLIIEYMGGGELFERVILDQSQLTELDAILFMRQIAKAVQYLHKNLILHLDMKPENILCMDRSTHHLKIIDFGLARKYNPRQKLMVQWGTPEFMAPEILNYEAVSAATDMWSVGVICFILLSGISPFLGDDDAETMDNIMDVSWAFDHEHFDDVSEDAKDFISRLLVEEKSGRLSAAQCLRHKWLSTPLTKQRRKALMSKKHLKNFMARMHWKASIAAVSAANWLRQQVGGTATTEDSAV